MFEAIGHPVLKLVRIRIGGLELGDLPIGKFKILNQKEAARALKVQ
jgi:16S rRNA U516 pseudouridylate synthase RsuA-like enzyme